MIQKPLFVIANSQTSRDLPFIEKEYLSPFPFKTSTEYIWQKGLVGAAGFYEFEANEIAKNCTPIGDVIPMNKISKKLKYKQF